MSWFRKALAITVPREGSYYSVMDPVEFYEWRFTGKAPQGSVFQNHLPPSDIFTENKIIVSAIVPPDSLKKTSDGFLLKEDSAVDVVLQIGRMLNAEELIEQNKQHVRTLSTGMDRFKEDAVTKLFVHSEEEQPSLYRIAEYTDDNVQFHNYGYVVDLIERFAEARKFFRENATEKKGRAYEMEEFRRYENTMEYVNNSHLYVDASKLQRLLQSANVEPKYTKKLPWKDFYLLMSKGARNMQNVIEKFNSMNWVKFTSYV